MYTNAKANDGNTVVVAAPSVKVKKDEYVRVEGTVVDMFEGTNAFGGKVTAPRVRGTTVQTITREEVIAPALKSHAALPTVAQHGLAITITKVELAESETRVYLKVVNRSTESASAYSHSIKLVQGSRQFEAKFSFDTNYPQLASDLLPGIEADAIVLYDAVNAAEPFRIVWDGPRTNNFRLQFQPYEWTVPA